MTEPIDEKVEKLAQWLCLEVSEYSGAWAEEPACVKKHHRQKAREILALLGFSAGANSPSQTAIPPTIEAYNITSENKKSDAAKAKRKSQRCVICGFDIKAEGKKPLGERGRQWGHSHEYGEKWICGYCIDQIVEGSGAAYPMERRGD